MQPGRALLVPGRTCGRLAHAERAGLLVDAHDYYVAFYRAAAAAKRYILLSGWQFDSKVELLRGESVALARDGGGHTKLLPFLNHLCERRPELEINILAWDFHVVLAFEREWMQRLYFHWRTADRLRFHFDDCHPDGGCHHQKFAVIDGVEAFIGGIDLCESRWDDRRHAAENPLRLARGRPQKPYHDAQAYLTGVDAAAPLVAIFEERWRRSKGPELTLPREPPRALAAHPAPDGLLALPPGPVAFSQTDPKVSEDGDDPDLCEITALHLEAIDAAERFIYFENQYFSSRKVRHALERRMRAAGRPRLQIAMVLNRRAEAIKEQLAVGLRQTENVAWLRRVAAETGHAFGCYYTVADGDGDGDGAAETYIHTKLMIVDDELFTVGSANLTNRSLGLDTELNVSWQAEGDGALARGIRSVRVSLLAEHAGLSDPTALNALARGDDLVDALDRLARDPKSRLQAHPPPSAEEEKLIAAVDPQALPFDPESSDELAPGDELAEDREILRRGLAGLLELVTGDK